MFLLVQMQTTDYSWMVLSTNSAWCQCYL